MSVRRKLLIENVSNDAWKRRMEGFDQYTSEKKPKKLQDVTNPVHSISWNFDAAGYSNFESTQESEPDIDMLPSSDEEEEAQIFDSQTTNETAVPALDADDGDEEGKELGRYSVHDEPATDIEIFNSPVFKCRSKRPEINLWSRQVTFSASETNRKETACEFNDVDEDDDSNDGVEPSNEYNIDGGGTGLRQRTLRSSRSQDIISEYESEEDEKSIDTEEDAETVSISPPPESQVDLQSRLGEVIPTSSMKGSKWINSLQQHLITPEKAPEPDRYMVVDSTSKKKLRLLKGGFAAKLSKLITRQNSAISCWLHQNHAASSVSESDKILVCSVISCVVDHGLLLAKCHITKGGSSSSATNSLILFNHETTERCKIAAGSVVRIFPPWQTLKLHESTDVILNTSRSVVVSESDKRDEESTEQREPTRQIAAWNCPCRSGPTFPAVCCQNPSLTFKSAAVHWPQDAENSDAAFANRHVSESAAALETCSPSPRPPPVQVSSSILESIECKGGSVAQAIDFCAAIQRIFCKSAPPSSQTSENGASLQTGSVVRWSLLVQDFSGFLCEVVLPEHFKPGSVWKQLTTAKLGSQWAFYNLQIGRRLTRPKCGRLFSVIDAVWKMNAVGDGDSADCQDDSIPNRHDTCPPSFCYTLEATETEASCRQWSPDISDCFTPYSYSSLQVILTDPAAKVSRVSFQARMLYCLNTEDAIRRFYVTDASLQEEATSSVLSSYVVLVVGDAVFISKGCFDKQVIAFNDIYLDGGQFVADEYSCLSVVNDRCSQLEFRPKLPSLTDMSAVHSLVAVSGSIVDIDDDTAYAWSVCDSCDNSKLGTSLQNNFFYCHDCKRSVTDPVTKMKLDVCLAMSTVPNVSVKIKLLQKTIESLLPMTSLNESYDVEQILDRHIDHLTCIVTSVNKTNRCVDRIELDEISLS